VYRKYSWLFDNQDIFVATSTNVYYSSDYGNSWTLKTSPASGIVSICSQNVRQNKVFVATSTNVYYSSDLGSSWTLKTSPASGIVAIYASYQANILI